MRQILFLLFLICSQSISAAEIGGYVTLTTDYVKRGVTQSDSDPALQLGAEVNFDNGFYFGAWASTVDINNGPTRQRDTEVNYYAGYLWEAADTLLLSATVIAYEFPGQMGSVDYGYQEYSVAANYDDRVWLEYAYSPDLYHSGDSSSNIDLYAEWPLKNHWAIGAGAGHYDVSNFTGESYQYWQLGITKSLQWADIDLRFYDTDSWVPVLSNPDRAKARVALKIQIPF